MEDISAILLGAFPALAEEGLSDQYIENHPDLTGDVPEMDLITVSFCPHDLIVILATY